MLEDNAAIINAVDEENQSDITANRLSKSANAQRSLRLHHARHKQPPR
jgi:hypothetical protein